MIAHINIGSNLGNRQENIDRAISELRKITAGSFISSPPFYSHAWGYESDNDYVNVGVMMETEMSPFGLLQECLRIERAMGSASHRKTDGTYADRMIDIDILACENFSFKSEILVVPHPQAALRSFVTVPMLQCLLLWERTNLSNQSNGEG